MEEQFARSIFGTLENWDWFISVYIAKRDILEIKHKSGEYGLKEPHNHMRKYLEFLGDLGIPNKHMYILFKDRKNMRNLGDMLGQLVYWKPRGGRKDGLIWKSDDDLPPKN